MPSGDEHKPCLVDTGQGLSVLYRKRYLYSRHNPSAAAEKIANTTEFRDNTLILCFSPVLGYGLETLSRRVPKNSFVLIVEVSHELFKLYNCDAIPSGFGLVTPSDIHNIEQLLGGRATTATNGVKIPPPGSFRRCERLDFSGATGIFPEVYDHIHHIADETIANFWKNRMTLVRLGRLYHRNLFRNLWKLAFSQKFMPHSITKPILVIGAGTTTDNVALYLRQLQQSQRKNIYIISVDAAAGGLIQQGIIPDAIVAQESQFAIQRAYADTQEKNIHIFADLTSRPAVLRPTNSGKGTTKEFCTNCTGGGLTFFVAAFADTEFYANLKNIGLLPEEIPALGSVGITATEIALRLRANKDTPIFICGLDFSFPAERTHAKGSPQTRKSLETQNRLQPAGTPKAAFTETARKVSDTGKFFTDYTLTRYANIFIGKYRDTPNLLNLGHEGIPLGIATCSTNDLAGVVLGATSEHSHEGQENQLAAETPQNNIARQKESIASSIYNFYTSEEAALTRLKNILTNGGAEATELARLLQPREYLYLHFPDGYKYSLETQFLKRVRAEIDFFLKDIQLGKKNL